MIFPLVDAITVGNLVDSHRTLVDDFSDNDPDNTWNISIIETLTNTCFWAEQNNDFFNMSCPATSTSTVVLWSQNHTRNYYNFTVSFADTLRITDTSNQYFNLGLSYDYKFQNLADAFNSFFPGAMRFSYYIKFFSDDGGANDGEVRLQANSTNIQLDLDSRYASNHIEIKNVTFLVNTSHIAAYFNDSTVPVLYSGHPTPSFYNVTGYRIWFSAGSHDSGRQTEVLIDDIWTYDVPAGNSPPVVVHVSPPNNTKNNTQLSTRFAFHDANQDAGNCSLIVNGTHHETVNVNDGDNTTMSSSGLSSGHYEYWINCTDGTDTTNMTHYLFTIDTGIPTITQGFPRGDNSTNIENPGIIYVNTNFTDDLGLYFMEINITNSTGLKYNITSNISYVPRYDFNATIDTSNWTNGSTFTYIARICDYHTKGFIDDAKDIIIGKESIEYDFDSTIINIKSFDLDLDSISTKKLSDRYTFDFVYDNPQLSRYFYLSSNYPIVYLKDSPFKAHFIINNQYWVDFEGVGKVEVEKWINDEYRIKVTSFNKTLSFSSVGELNCNERVSTFVLTGESIPTNITGYSELYLNETGWFNLEALDTTTTAGVLMWFFVFIILVGMVVLAEYMSIPALMVLVGILGIFYGFLLYSVISAIMGIFFIILFFGYMIRGGFAAKD